MKLTLTSPGMIGRIDRLVLRDWEECECISRYHHLKSNHTGMEY